MHGNRLLNQKFSECIFSIVPSPSTSLYTAYGQICLIVLGDGVHMNLTEIQLTGNPHSCENIPTMDGCIQAIGSLVRDLYTLSLSHVATLYRVNRQ